MSRAPTALPIGSTLYTHEETTPRTPLDLCDVHLLVASEAPILVHSGTVAYGAQAVQE